jgi:hypothetical protein
MGRIAWPLRRHYETPARAEQVVCRARQNQRQVLLGQANGQASPGSHRRLFRLSRRADKWLGAVRISTPRQNSLAQEYLGQFFGRSASFELIRGGAPALQPGARAALGHLTTPFTDLSAAIASDASEALNVAVDHFAEQAAVAIPDPAQPAERRLGAVLSAALAPDAVRAACNGGTDENPTIVPRTPSDIGTVLFPNASSSAALESAIGLLAALARAQSAQGNPLLPLRAHLFFRNVQGVWACSNPSCTQVSRNDRNILIGRLFDRPTPTCDCGSRVLELLYCEPCGDVFLGGYRREVRPGVWSLVPDDPNIEKALRKRPGVPELCCLLACSSSKRPNPRSAEKSMDP